MTITTDEQSREALRECTRLIGRADALMDERRELPFWKLRRWKQITDEIDVIIEQLDEVQLAISEWINEKLRFQLSGLLGDGPGLWTQSNN